MQECYMNERNLRPQRGAAVGLLASFLIGGVFSVQAQSVPVEHFGCRIEPRNVVDVSTREEGIVASFSVQRGDVVATGQVLAQLDSQVEQAVVDVAAARTQMSAQLDERRVELAHAERELKRMEELSANQAVPRADRDRVATDATRARLRLSQTQHLRRLARLELEHAKRLLARRTIVSPVAGVVLEVLLAPGESVENLTLLRVAEMNPLNVEVILPVDHFGTISVGETAQITPKYPGAQRHQATVAVVDRVLDSASDTFGVRLTLQNPDLMLPAGVRCEIELIRD